MGVPVLIVALVAGLATNAGPTGLAGVTEVVVGLVASALYAAYTIVLISRGRTLGMRVLGTRCIREDTGQPPSLGQSALRWLVPDGGSYILRSLATFPLLSLVLFPIVLLDSLWMLWDPKKQTLHDKVAGTLVVSR